MLLSLLLASIRILSCFREKIKAKLALAIPTSASTMLVKETIDTPPLVALKTIKILSM